MVEPAGMRSLLFAVAVGLLACSGSQKKDSAKKDDWDPQDMSVPDPKPATDDDDAGERGDDDDEPAPRHHPVSQADDYELQHSDCDALGLAYGRSWENDEIKKLGDKKITDSQLASIKQNADEAAQNYKEECGKTVGTAYIRDRLKCAVKAKSLERFNACLDGSAE
jgi:hypothetical protein